MNQKIWVLLMGVFLTAGTAASSPNPLEIYQRALASHLDELPAPASHIAAKVHLDIVKAQLIRKPSGGLNSAQQGTHARHEFAHEKGFVT